MPSDYVEKLRASRLRAWSAAKEIAERAAEENRAMSAEEERSWDKANGEVDAYDRRIKEVIAGEKRAQDTEDAFAAVRGKPEERSVIEGYEKAWAEADAQLRSMLRGQTNKVEFKLPSPVEMRALAKSAATVPVTFVGTIYQYLVDNSSVRAANPTVLTTSSGENMTIPRSTAEGAATWTAEGVALTESDPTLSSVTLSSYGAKKLLKVSSEMVDDVGFDLLSYVAEHMARNIAILTDTAYVVGTGGTQPAGFMPNATVGVTQVTGNTTALTTANSSDVLFDMYHSVIPQYRLRGSWVMNDALVKIIRKLRDTTGQYLWQPGLQFGQPDTLLGRPVIADPNVASPVGANNLVAAFGEFAGYFIRDVSPIRFERSNDAFFANDQIGFRAVFRTDGALVDTNAVKTLKNSAT